MSTPNLAGHLRDVSAAAANVALDHYRAGTIGSVIISATSAGVAIEAAMKYSLAVASPLLIAKNPDNAALLARSATEPIDVSTLRTLDGTEAARALRILRPRSKSLPTAKTIETVLLVRNAAVHIGHVTTEDLDRSLKAMVSAVNAITADLEDLDDYWNDVNVELAESLGQEALELTSLELQIRLTAARRRYELLGKATVDVLEDRTITMASPPGSILFRCPVCDHQALVERYITKSDLDFTGARYPDEHPSGYRYAYPETFSCLVCGLELEGDTELDFAVPGLQEIWEEELEPSEEFERALEDWRYESRRELEAENLRDYF